MSEKIVVGIDVSKAFSDICILSPNNDIIKSMKISNDVIGMNLIIFIPWGYYAVITPVAMAAD